MRKMENCYLMISIMPGDGGFNGNKHMGKSHKNGYN